MKGIILAGGYGTRLLPITKYLNKHLIPVCDKPMIYYPLSTLLKMGINEILIVTNSKDKKYFSTLLGDGRELGCSFRYLGQGLPSGTGGAFINANKFINNDNVAVILGDNIYGEFDYEISKKFTKAQSGAIIYAKKVEFPHRYGIAELISGNKVVSIEEKPVLPKSNYAITGLYLFDEMLVPLSKAIKQSERGEYEITDIIKYYLSNNQLSSELLSENCFWFDAGTISSLETVSSYIQVFQNSNKVKIGCIEEVAYQQGFITKKQIKKIAEKLVTSEYGQYLLDKYE